MTDIVLKLFLRNCKIFNEFVFFFPAILIKFVTLFCLVKPVITTIVFVLWRVCEVFTSSGQVRYKFDIFCFGFVCAMFWSCWFIFDAILLVWFVPFSWPLAGWENYIHWKVTWNQWWDSRALTLTQFSKPIQSEGEHLLSYPILLKNAPTSAESKGM